MNIVSSTVFLVGVFCFSTLSQALPINGDGVKIPMAESAHAGRMVMQSLRISVPEPSIVAILGLCLIWIGIRRSINRKKRS
jgi:hypothetical protein